MKVPSYVPSNFHAYFNRRIKAKHTEFFFVASSSKDISEIVSVTINLLLTSILECPLSPSPPGTRTVASSANRGNTAPSANNGNRATYFAGWPENYMEGSLAKCVRALTFHVFSLDAIQFAGEKAAENTNR